MEMKLKRHPHSSSNPTHSGTSSQAQVAGLSLSTGLARTRFFTTHTFDNIKSEEPGSQGGAIYSSVQSANSVIEISSNSFRECQAEQGGAIMWDYREALLQNNAFESNEASLYAKDIRSYGRKLLFLN